MSLNLDRLFEQAKNNSAMLNELTECLMSEGRKAVQSIIRRYNVVCTANVDTEGFILEVINYIYSNYQEGRISFEKYARYVMNKRLTSMIVSACSLSTRISYSLDTSLPDGTPIIEILPSTGNSTIPDEISYDDYNLILSSPKADVSKTTNFLKNNVRSLRMKGYSSKEIQKLLKINENQYRYIIKLIGKDIQNIIELK